MMNDIVQDSPMPSPDSLLEKAREIHQHIYDEIDNAGAGVAVVGIIFTNMLTAARLSGADEEFIDQILNTIKQDVEGAVAEMREANNLN